MDRPKHHPTFAPSSIPALNICRLFKSEQKDSGPQKEGTDQHQDFADYFLTMKTPENEDTLWACEEAAKIADSEVLLIEEELTVFEDGFTEITYGTADIVVPSKQMLIDLKTGEEHDYWLQMLPYALACMQKYDQPTWRACIVYSRLRIVDYYDFNETEIEQLLEIKKKTEEPLKPDEEPVANDYCSWCSKQTTCPAVTSKAMAVLKGREDWVLENYHSSQISDPVQMAKAMQLAKLLEKWCEAVKFQATSMAMKGEEIEGFTLHPGKKKRQLDIHKAFEIFEDSAEFLSCCTVKIPLLQKKLDKNDFKETIEPMIVVTEGAPYLQKMRKV